MKVRVENLGVLKQAEFEVGDFTLICGDNNTGKTYAAYALYGFLASWRRWLSVEIPKPAIDSLLKERATRIDVRPFVKRAGALLEAGCERYTRHLPDVLGARASRFKETRFQVSLDDRTLSSAVQIELGKEITKSDGKMIFSVSKDTGDSSVIISLLPNDHTDWSPEIIQPVISNWIIELLFRKVLSQPFMVSAERTGGSLFRDQLDYRPNQITTDELVQNLRSGFAAPGYPIPVQDNVNFMRRLEHVVKTDSFLAMEHGDVLDEFSDIIGGDVRVDGNGVVSFKPARRRVRLTIDETSSSVRSLLILGLYLRHVAQPDHLLMIDEPELNLHPSNQRRIARLFARLVNLEIRVFTTTHSDYIAKEMDNLIMLNQDHSNLKKFAETEKYRPEELLKPDQVKVYVTKQAATGGKNRSGHDYTLEPVSVDSEIGIGAISFDETIDEMNSVQDIIVGGRDG